ncbi:MAG TPA: hypothetical protein VGD29_05755 [Actinoplanes sp.]
MSSTPNDEVRRPFRRYRSRTPEITALFWIMKVVVSVAGGLLAALISGSLGLGITTMLVTTAVAVTMLIQFAAARYLPWLYWLTTVMIGIFGVLAVDNLTDTFEVPPGAAAIALALLLVATFIAWYATEKTLSIHTVDTTRRETFYWLAVLLTFALGTAAERFGFAVLGLGYGSMAVAAAALTVLLSAGHRFARLGAETMFWLAYAITQPLGAALSDLLTRPRDTGGLGFGVVAVSGAVLAVFVVAVAYTGVTHRDDPSLHYATRHVRPRSEW